jgi:hypothetical protein
MEKIFVKLKDAGASYIDSTQERPLLLHGAEPFEVEATEMIKLGIRRGALVLSEGTPTESTEKAKEVKESKPKGKAKEEVQEPVAPELPKEPTEGVEK